MGILLLAIVCTGSFYSAVFNKKHTVQMPLCYMLGVTIVLYLFYILDLLSIGYTLIVLFSLLVYICSIIYFIKSGINKSNLIGLVRRFFTPAMVLFFIMFVFYYYYTLRNQVLMMDELRLWGAYPKILYYTDKIQLGKEALLFDFVKSYPPGMPLLSYFIIKTRGFFWEGGVYFTYALLNLMILIIPVSHIRWDKSYKLIIYAIIIFYTPLIFNNSNNDLGNFYKSLFIDPVLGISIGYMFYQLKDCGKDTFSKINFIFISLFVVLLKDSGIIFAIIALAAYAAANLKRIKSKIKEILLLALPVLVICMSWQYLLGVYGIAKSLQYEVSGVNFNFLKYFISLLLRQQLMSSNNVTLSRFLSYAMFMGFFAMAGFVVYHTIPKHARCRYTVSALALLFSNIVFICGLYFLFTNTFNEHTYSYSRYICTILTSNLIFLLMYTVSFSSDSSLALGCKAYQWLAALCIAFMIVAFPIRTPKLVDEYWMERAQYHSSLIEKEFRGGNVGAAYAQANVYLIINGAVSDVGQPEPDHVGLHHRVYYNLLGTGIRIKNFYNQIRITEADAAQDRLMEIKNNWENKLLEENYHYVYVCGADDLFIDQYGSFFETVPEAGVLYKIIPVDGRVRLCKASII